MYGPLFGELTSKRWAAEPHAVEVIADASKSARANLFERRPYGAGTWVLAVGFAAADQESAVVRVRVDGDAFSAAAVRPDGAPAGSAAVADAGPGEIDVTVPLARGAGVVVLERLGASQNRVLTWYQLVPTIVFLLQKDDDPAAPAARAAGP